MAEMSNYLENALINATLRNTSYTSPLMLVLRLPLVRLVMALHLMMLLLSFRNAQAHGEQSAGLVFWTLLLAVI
jgi:hypothetical protein